MRTCWNVGLKAEEGSMKRIRYYNFLALAYTQQGAEFQAERYATSLGLEVTQVEAISYERTEVVL